MMVFVDFNDLDTFNCKYGVSEESSGVLRIFVEGGLSFPHGILVKQKDGVRFVRCERTTAEGVESIFPRHYIFDPSRGAEYVEWELDDGLLRACTRQGEWVKYTSRADSKYAMHEFVGGCWFVFGEACFSKRITSEYTADRKKSTGNEVVQEFGSRSCVDIISKNYFLEGVLEVPPGPGWMSWDIYAKSFHIEIPDEH